MAPALDVDLFSQRPVVEKEHDPSACVKGHDHTLCSQVSAGKWMFTAPAPPWLRLDHTTLTLRALSVRTSTLREAASPLPRAPPLI